MSLLSFIDNTIFGVLSDVQSTSRAGRHRLLLILSDVLLAIVSFCALVPPKSVLHKQYYLRCARTSIVHVQIHNCDKKSLEYFLLFVLSTTKVRIAVKIFVLSPLNTNYTRRTWKLN